MDTNITMRRAQVYRLLCDAFLYPADDWTGDLDSLTEILHELDVRGEDLSKIGIWELPDLRTEYTRALGVTGALCYETEYGLPHEFRQSQELADLAGFYRAFGFGLGGQVRERPDHVAVELEFMCALALKKAYAASQGLTEEAEICADAERNFLRDHLGRWIGLLAERLAQMAPSSPYRRVADFTVGFILADAKRLGVTIEPQLLTQVFPTPSGPDLSCQDCPAAGFED